jgi:hypothetical protein
MECFDHALQYNTHAREVLPAPGGPNTSVTLPRRIPPQLESRARASSRRVNPVEIGETVDALRDCDADMEMTGPGECQWE